MEKLHVGRMLYYARYLGLGMRYEAGICTIVISMNGVFRVIIWKLFSCWSQWCNPQLHISFTYLDIMRLSFRQWIHMVGIMDGQYNREVHCMQFGWMLEHLLSTVQWADSS